MTNIRLIAMINKHNDIFIHDKVMPSFLRRMIFLFSYFLDIWWGILLLVARLKYKKKNHVYEFSICAIFKDESLSLKEWIEYHRLIGVDHIWLYNNNSTDDYLEILESYIQENYVTLVEWPIAPPSQIPAYQHFHDNFWKETHWVAFIDMDEYIVPIYKENIKEWVSDFNTFPSLVLYWKPFGSAGLIEHDKDKLIIEQYNVAWNRFEDIGKPVFNTDYEVYEFSRKRVHNLPAAVNLFGRKFMLPPVNEFRKFTYFHCNRVGIGRSKEDFTIQINHYVTKSYKQFFENKRKRGAPTSVGEAQKVARSAYAYEFVQAYSVKYDVTIYKYIIPLKLRLNPEIPNYIKTSD